VALTWENKQEIWSLFFKGDSKESISSQVKRKRKGEEGLPIDKRVVYKVTKEWEDLSQDQVAFLRAELREIKNTERNHFDEVRLCMERFKQELIAMLAEKHFEKVAKEEDEQNLATLAQWYHERSVEYIKEVMDKNGAYLKLASESDRLFGCLPYHILKKEFWDSVYKLKKGGIGYINALSQFFELARNKVEDASGSKVVSDYKAFISILRNGKRDRGEIHSLLASIGGALLTPYFVETVCCLAICEDVTPLWQYRIERVVPLEVLLFKEKVLAIGDVEALHRLGDLHAKIASDLKNREDERTRECWGIIAESERLVRNMLNVLDETLRKVTLPGSCPRCSFSIKRLRGKPNPERLVAWLNA
jgi:hypothetical protein